MEEADRAVALGDHQGHVVFFGFLHDDAGQGVLLDPDLDLNVRRGPEIAPVQFRCRLQAVLDAREGRGLPHPPGIVGDVFEWDLTGLAHIDQQAADSALVFLLSLMRSGRERSGRRTPGARSAGGRPLGSPGWRS